MEKSIVQSYNIAKRKVGRPLQFETAEQLWIACVDYFEWVEENPLFETKIAQSGGIPTKIKVPLARAMTQEAMCLHIGITDETWRNYREREDFFGVTTRVDAMVYTQKFEGAAANLFNANIIARDLGLKDKQQYEVNNVTSLSREQLEAKLKHLLEAPKSY
jgi:hypothetical protein